MSNVTVNVTKMFAHLAPNYVSASASELGQDAGQITWRSALEIAEDRDSWLVTNVHEACDAVRKWAQDTGAWDDVEREAWSIAECLALLAQNVASDLRNHFNQDTCVDTDAVVEALDAMDEPECGCYYYRADINANADLMADWYA